MEESGASIIENGGEYFQFFNEIGIINQLATNRLERVLPFGLTSSQFGVLNHFVRGLPPKSPLELANAFQVTKGAMTNTVKQLSSKGFVEVVPHPVDGRSKIVSISHAGREAHKESQIVLAQAFADFVAAFDKDQLSAMLPMLSEVRMWLDNNRK